MKYSFCTPGGDENDGSGGWWAEILSA